MPKEFTQYDEEEAALRSKTSSPAPPFLLTSVRRCCCAQKLTSPAHCHCHTALVSRGFSDFSDHSSRVCYITLRGPLVSRRGCVVWGGAGRLALSAASAAARTEREGGSTPLYCCCCWWALSCHSGAAAGHQLTLGRHTAVHLPLHPLHLPTRPTTAHLAADLSRDQLFPLFAQFRSLRPSGPPPSQLRCFQGTIRQQAPKRAQERREECRLPLFVL